MDEVKLVVKSDEEMREDVKKLLTWAMQNDYVCGKIRSVGTDLVVCVTISGYRQKNGKL